MSKKILSDFKINKNNIILKNKKIETATEEIPVSSSISFHSTNTHSSNDNSNQDSSHKYDFLKRKNINSIVQFKRIPATPKMPSSGKSFSKPILLIFILSLIVGALYLFSNKYLSLNIVITPKNKVFELKNQIFTADKAKTKTVPFELMIVSDEMVKDAVLTSSAEVSEFAKGKIVFYNEYSNKTQKLALGTFLADEKGKTYKTVTTVTIPGFTMNKTKVVPGQAFVDIRSFLAGEMYNGSPSSFYVISFKGTTKYNKIYGKINTPLTGGMTGLIYSLEDKEKENLLSNVSELKDKLYRQLGAQIPEGYILYPSAVQYTYLFGDNITSKNPNIQLRIKGTLSAYLLKQSDLVNLIINKLMPEIKEEERLDIVPPNLSLVSFNFVSKDQLINKDVEGFDFYLTGDLSVDWRPNIDKLKQLLVNKEKNLVNSILKNNPGIDSADVTIIPFWSSVLPKEAKNINISIKKLTKN